MMQVDKINRKILDELSQNARQSNASIAKKLRTSKEVVNYRIKKLEESKIIRGSHTIIDYKQIGYQSYRVLMKMSHQNPELENRIIKYLKSLKTVNFLVTIAEEYDIAVIFNEPTQESFMKKYNDFLFKFSKYILSKEVNIINDIKQFTIPFSENKKQLFSFQGVDKLPSINDEDKKILKLIAKNGRFSYVSLANVVGKNANSIIYKIRNLERKQVIKGYSVDIDWRELGYVHYKVFLYFSEIDKKTMKSIMSYLSTIRELIYITEAIGDQDLEFELLCKSQLDLIQKLNELKKKFPGTIKKTISFITLNTYEINYFPLI